MNRLEEIHGVKGIFKISSQKIMYEFICNSNFICCLNYETGKIVKQINRKVEGK